MFSSPWCPLATTWGTTSVVLGHKATWREEMEDRIIATQEGGRKPWRKWRLQGPTLCAAEAEAGTRPHGGPAGLGPGLLHGD